MRSESSNTRAGALARLGRAGAVAGAVAVSTLVLAASPASAADQTKSFQPVRKTEHALIFRVRGVMPDRVIAAWTRLRGRGGKGHAVEHRLSVSRVRSAARRRGLLRVSRPRSIGGGRLTVQLAGASQPAPAGASQPAPPPSGCEVDPATLTAVGCSVLRQDTATATNPEAGLWGNIESAADSRYQHLSSGGDPGPMATAASQGNVAYRRLTAIDGDNFWGERCELGRNEHRYGENTGSQTAGTFALYRAGDHKLTFFSQRYPTSFPTDATGWQTVMQMKQTQPYDYNGGGGPVLELQLWQGRLYLQNSWSVKWSTTAPAKSVWIRYALDVVYSTDPAVGSVTVYVDLNGDGDALDAGEQSPQIHTQTVVSETADPAGQSSDTDGITPGQPIPDHLRIGIYHNPSISCPSPGCSVDVDNVQVVG